MFKTSISAFLIVVSFQSVMAQPKLIEKVKAQPGAVSIPYEKYQLSNGLTVILHEDHSDPLCHVDVTYHVGSAREQIGKSGFAHFFEHMMFQGSDNVADEQHFKIITEAGGTLNGTTNRDRTNYFETVPNNQLEKMLWLEADRMGFLLDAVTQQKFEIQRATVKNERGQRYDNQPYGLVQEVLSKNLYPYGHPYSWLTIGYIEDLNRVDVQDLKNFFLRWYGPNNAVLTVGGDINIKKTLQWIDKYFGSIPRGPEVEKTVLPAPVLNTNRFVTMTDDYAKLPMLLCALPTVEARHKDEAALDCLADILGGGNTSLLYQALVKKQIVLRANASHPTSELAGNLQFSFVSKDDLKQAYSVLKEIIDNFDPNAISQEQIDKFKQSQEASIIYGLESVSGKVSSLASYQTFTGNANYIQNELKRYVSITKADIIRVFNNYIKNKAMLVLSVVPKGKNQSDIEVNAPNFSAQEDKQYIAPDYGYEKLNYTKAKDKFDRSIMPATGSNPVIKVPEYTKMNADGMKGIVHTTHETPVVVVSIDIEGGRKVESKMKDKLGITELFANLMDEDTKKHTAEEFQTALDKLGTSISISPSYDQLNLTMRCLKKNLNASLDLLYERLFEPQFTEEALSRVKNQTIENIKNSKTRGTNVASQVFNTICYSNQSILGSPSMGNVNSVSNITLQDIQQYYNTHIKSNQLELVCVGDIENAEASKIFSKLAKLPKRETIIPHDQSTQQSMETKNTLYFVDIPKSAQTEFRIGNVTNLKYDVLGEYYESTLMNFPLGGAFNSRININLREDKGWTYGARSRFSANKYTGTYLFSSGIKATASDSALVEVLKEMKNYAQGGITKDELNFLKSAIGQSEARNYETLFQKARFLSEIIYYNLSEDFVTKQYAILKNMSAEKINKLSKKWIQTDQFLNLLVGDKESLWPKLQKLGYTLVELDADGNIK
ncbi:MAG: pitrilysin family protein [Chitinophagaceae bacterium]